MVEVVDVVDVVVLEVDVVEVVILEVDVVVVVVFDVVLVVIGVVVVTGVLPQAPPVHPPDFRAVVRVPLYKLQHIQY